MNFFHDLKLEKRKDRWKKEKKDGKIGKGKKDEM